MATVKILTVDGKTDSYIVLTQAGLMAAAELGVHTDTIYPDDFDNEVEVIGPYTDPNSALVAKKTVQAQENLILG